MKLFNFIIQQKTLDKSCLILTKKCKYEKKFTPFIKGKKFEEVYNVNYIFKKRIGEPPKLLSNICTGRTKIEYYDYIDLLKAKFNF